MRKLLAVLFMLAVFMLSGCTDIAEEETGTLNYEQMDKEFGQYKEPEENETDDSLEFAEDIPVITAEIEEYTECLLTGDASRYAKAFPNDYIIAIMNQEGMTWDDSVEYSISRVWKIFNTVENKYKTIKELQAEHGYSVEIESISRFSKEEQLLKIYESYGIKLTDAIEVDYKIISNDKSAEAYLRLVKTENGKWEPDMSYFEI